MDNRASIRRNAAASATWLTIAVIAGAGLAAIAMAVATKTDDANQALRQCDDALERLQKRLTGLSSKSA